MKMKFWFCWIISLSGLFTVTRGVRITALEVPPAALVGDDVRLLCDYDGKDGSPLYSLKWYKDGHEFYRHVPRSGQASTQRCSSVSSAPFPTGVVIDCWASSEREVVLSGVSGATSGEYRCEVIGDHPDFRREEKRARLKVFSEPLQTPIIRGALKEYRVGDLIFINCSSRNAEYIPELSWFIDGRRVVTQEHRQTPSSTHYQGDHTLSLMVTADQKTFSSGDVEATCRAALGPKHVKNTSVRLLIPGLLKPQYYSTASAASSQVEVVTLAMVLWLYSY